MALEILPRDRIIELLKKENKMSTGKISNLSRINYYECLIILDKMEKEGIIIKERFGKNYNYWKLNDKNKRW